MRLVPCRSSAAVLPLFAAGLGIFMLMTGPSDTRTPVIDHPESHYTRAFISWPIYGKLADAAEPAGAADAGVLVDCGVATSADRLEPAEFADHGSAVVSAAYTIKPAEFADHGSGIEAHVRPGRPAPAASRWSVLMASAEKLYRNISRRSLPEA